MLLVRDIRLPLAAGEQEAVAAALKKTGLPRHGIKNTGIAKLSVDAQHGRPSLVYTVALELADEGAERSFERFAPYVSIAAPAALTVHNGTRPLAHSPVVCGLGPAGLFAALLLARQGFRPIVLERGPAMEQRAQAVGASRGGPAGRKRQYPGSAKAARSVSDAQAHHAHQRPLYCFLSPGRCWRMARPGYCLQAEAAHRHRCCGCYCVYRRRSGAGREGAFNTPLTGTCGTGGLRRCATPQGNCPAGALLLAPGHSARDTFEMLDGAGFTLQAKPFSVGFFRPSTCSAALKKAFTTMRRAIRLCRGVSTSFPSMWADGAFTPSVCVRAAAWWRPPAKRAAQ